MKPEELFPQNWKKIIDSLDLINEKQKNMATTDIFTCKKCKKIDVAFIKCRQGQLMNL